MDRGQEIRELKLGASFTNPNARASYHTLKCKFHMFFLLLRPIRHKKLPHFNFLLLISDDFKPASVDAHKEATLETGSNSQVTVTVPHLGNYV